MKTMINFEYKEMEYKSEREIEILCEGKYKDYQFYVVSLGTHPTAYVKIPFGNKLYGKKYQEIEDIDVHGGLTYSRDYLLDKNEKGWYIGWDYAHYGDYVGFMDFMDLMFNTFEMSGDTNGKKWTTKEILGDCFNVINQIIEKEYRYD